MSSIREMLDEMATIADQFTKTNRELSIQLVALEFEREYWHRQYIELNKKMETDHLNRTGKELWASLTEDQTDQVTWVYNDGAGGNLIAAVKQVRDLTGWGLVSSKRAVDYYVRSRTEA